MSGLFDKLQDELTNRESEGGISPLDLAELPSQLRKVMRHLLREVEAPFDNILEHVKTLPKEDQLSKEDLGKGLATLAKQGWVIVMGEKDNVRYRVNLRRKPSSSLASNIWAALDDKIVDHIKTEPAEDEESGES